MLCDYDADYIGLIKQMQIKINQIVIKDRFRNDYGDMQGLADSIADIGQLQPIGIDANYRLIFGERRIKALQLLGADSIDGNIIHLENILKGEFAENEFSEGWKTSERVAILKAIETKQEGRQPANSENFPSKSEAAKTAGFGNERTARDATKVVNNGTPELVEKMDSGEVSVSAAAKIASMPDEEQEEIIEEIDSGAKPSEVIKAHVSNNTGQTEWYTPEKYVKSARLVMGSINLDPASSDMAQEHIKADSYYTEETDSLDKEWFGNIWMNPPYENGAITKFIDKLKDSDFESAVVLVNNATETKWFQSLASVAARICFVSSRIKFIDGEGNKSGTPLQGQAILLSTEDEEVKNRFTSEFSKHGFIVEIINA